MVTTPLPLRERALPRWVDGASLAALFVALLGLTWRRWPDPLVDFWRNLYIPWQVSEGALLYRDVADWYGPLPTLVMASVFGVAGPGLDALLVVNALVAVGCLLALHASLARIGGRGSAWVGTAAVVLVFVFGQYTRLGNYNFMTPYVSQATWGLLGVLLTLEGCLAQEGAASRRGWLVAGAGLAIALLSKPECLLAASVVLAGHVALRRALPARSFWAALAGVVLPIWLLLTAAGGVAYGLEATFKALSFPLSTEARTAVASIPIFDTFMGTDAPLKNALEQLRWGGAAMLVLALVAATPPALERQRPGRSRGLPLMVGGLVGLAGLAWAVEWLTLGRSLVVTGLAALALGLSRCRGGSTRGVGLAVFSLASLAMLARMALNPRLHQYGFTMALPATALLVHLAVFEAPRLFGERPGITSGVSLAVALLVLTAAGRLTYLSLANHGAKSLALGQGRDAILTYPASIHRNGALVQDMLAAIPAHAPGAKSLVVFPDGAAVNYLSRTPSPIPEFEFNPTSLAFAGGAEAVVARFAASPPEAVLISTYDLRGHGAPFFGATPASGAGFVELLQRHYRLVASGPAAPLSITGHAWDLFVLKPAP